MSVWRLDQIAAMGGRAVVGQVEGEAVHLGTSKEGNLSWQIALLDGTTHHTAVNSAAGSYAQNLRHQDQVVMLKDSLGRIVAIDCPRLHADPSEEEQWVKVARAAWEMRPR
jgi:hypothetical protein